MKLLHNLIRNLDKIHPPGKVKGTAKIAREALRTILRDQYKSIKLVSYHN